MSSNSIGECRLCKKETQLLESHIIPKFAIRWMKETGTGYLRRVAAPNLREQDGAKQRLLCVECEQLFSSREGYFAAEIFRPILAGATNVCHDARLAYFVVSLLWRNLHRNLDQARAEKDQFIEHMCQAEEEWRHFLLGTGKLNRFDQLHLFVTDIAVQNPPGAPNFNLYCARSLDATSFAIENRCYVVTKFARFFFIGLLTPYDPQKWKGTRIATGEGRIQIPQAIEDLAFGGWLLERAKFAFAKFDSTLSRNQKNVIKAHIQKRLPNIEKSDLFRAANADESDYRRVLSQAGRVGRNDRCPCGSGLKFKKCHGQGLL